MFPQTLIPEIIANDPLFHEVINIAHVFTNINKSSISQDQALMNHSLFSLLDNYNFRR